MFGKVNDSVWEGTEEYSVLRPSAVGPTNPRKKT